MAISFGKWVFALDGSSLPARELIGGKAWSVARMVSLGLKVPPCIVVSTEACVAYFKQGGWPEGLTAEIEQGVKWLEEQTDRTFGKGISPLLVSVRSGSPVSMPGMMDTILNLGINDLTQVALAQECGNAQFACDTHRRFIDLYANIVLKASLDGVETSVYPEQLRAQVKAACGSDVPNSVDEQLQSSVKAVFESWNTRRAKRYRKHHDIPEHLGTAVAIQAMVFGNMDERSGTGVLFSRNPLTGDKVPYGEFLARAQGEDIVSGKHTPEPLDALKDLMPHVHEELIEYAMKLEFEDADVQDIEFTVEKGALYFLQTRAAKRAPGAAARIAVDFVEEGKIDIKEALKRVTVEQARLSLSPRLAEGAAESAVILAKGEGASPGVGMGIVVCDSDKAEASAEKNESVVLVRKTTSPDDVHGMIAAKAIVTEQGGATSHAAVVGRALGRPCVVGCGDGALMALDGEYVTVDGSQGMVYAGKLPVIVPDENSDDVFAKLLSWSADYAPVKVVSSKSNICYEVLDLDLVDGIEDSQRLLEIIKGLCDVKVISLSEALIDESVAAAIIEAGIETVVTYPTLPVLLALAHVSLKTNRVDGVNK